MSTQASQKLEMLQSEGQLDSSEKPPQFINDVESIIEPMRGLSEKQILSYLTRTASESYIQSPYTELTQETANISDCVTPPTLYPRIRAKHQDSFIALQKWEGVVLQVMEEYFLARLIDLTNEGPDEEAELPIEEISQEDLDLVKPGAVFYWSIGYLDRCSGQRTRASVIRFRRLPAWNSEEIEAAKQEAGRIQEFIGWK